MNVTLDVLVPVAVVTIVTAADPADPAGVTHLAVVLESQVDVAQATPFTLTVTALETVPKLLPVTVSTVPPITGPLEGLMDVREGSAM